jgi:hypothetical protein
MRADRVRMRADRVRMHTTLESTEVDTVFAGSGGSGAFTSPFFIASEPKWRLAGVPGGQSALEMVRVASLPEPETHRFAFQ